MTDFVPSYLDLEDPFETQVNTRDIIDVPAEFDFSKFSLKSDSSLPNDLRERTESLLKVDLDNEIVSPHKLRTLVSAAARLLSEHDLIIKSRNKVYESMNKMHHLEKEATIKLYSQLNLEKIDEETRKIIRELSEKLGNLATPAEHEDSPFFDSGKERNNLNVTPSPDLPCDVESNTSSHDNEQRISPKLFCVPPPDPTRPPPGFVPERFPSLLEPPPISTSLPMCPSNPPPSFNIPFGRTFAIPNRCRPPMLMPIGMPKVHLGHIVPLGGDQLHNRRRFSAGSERNRRGHRGNFGFFRK